jgi:hypothetical protein
MTPARDSETLQRMRWEIGATLAWRAAAVYLVFFREADELEDYLHRCGWPGGLPTVAFWAAVLMIVSVTYGVIEQLVTYRLAADMQRLV